MTILNVYSGSQSGWIAVDTDAVHHADGRHFDCPKMIPLPHLNAVIAMRGTAGFLPSIFATVLTSFMAFDELAENLPNMLSNTFREMICRATESRSVMAADIGKETVVLIGWSRKFDRVVAIRYEQQEMRAGFVAEIIPAAYFAPGEGFNSPEFKDPFDKSAMIELANRQVRAIRAHAPGQSAGGRYILATIDREGMSIATIANLAQSE